MRVDPSNVDQLGYWDGASGAYWARHATRFDEGVAAYRADFVAAMDLSPDEDVLDVGCGSGETTRDAAARARSALGVDLSGPMLEVARTRSGGLPNVRFEQADAQIHPFEPVDVIVSRTGAGCRTVTFTPHEAPMYFGPDPSDAAAFLAAQHDMAPAAADRLRADMRDHTSENGVTYDSAAWFVSAYR